MAMPVMSKEILPKNLVNSGLEEKLGSLVPQDIPFQQSNGKSITFKDILTGEKPIILNLVYFNCPMLCQLVLTSFQDSLSKLPDTLRNRFDIVSLSFDPKDTPESAACV